MVCGFLSIYCIWVIILYRSCRSNLYVLSLWQHIHTENSDFCRTHTVIHNTNWDLIRVPMVIKCPTVFLSSAFSELLGYDVFKCPSDNYCALWGDGRKGHFVGPECRNSAQLRMSELPDALFFCPSFSSRSCWETEIWPTCGLLGSRSDHVHSVRI